MLAGLGILLGGTCRGEDRPLDGEKPPAFEQFLVVPLQVHILGARDLPEIDCHLSDDDIARILGKVNGIWHRAGIHWGLESIRREPAARQERFRLARAMEGLTNPGLYGMLLPKRTGRFEGLHMYYLHEFPVNGVWFGEDYAIVRETATLRAVEGGIDEPIPRVTAHELGHALGLSHRQDTTNLLASGTTGTLLNAREIETARESARSIKGVKTVAALKAAANESESSGKPVEALDLWSWLGEIPGADKETREAIARLRRKVHPAPGRARPLRNPLRPGEPPT
ncbi:MAG: hypothetical protein NVSMB9_14090 [Isosphaeraceae bacterium]